MANGEILGVTLLMEDVLQTGYQDVSLLTEHSGGGEPDKGKERKPRSSSARSLDVKRMSTVTGLAPGKSCRFLLIYVWYCLHCIIIILVFM